MTLEFWMTSLIVVLIPGTGVVYTISTGVSLGWRASVFASLGCTLGIVPHVLASILGLAALMDTSAVAFTILKYLGVAYLLYLAWGMWRNPTTELVLDGGHRGSRGFQVALKGFLMNILNPKLTIFFLAFLPQFLDKKGGDELWQMIGLSGAFMVLTLVVFLLYGFLGHGIRSAVERRPRILFWMSRGFSVLFGALGLRLAIPE